MSIFIMHPWGLIMRRSKNHYECLQTKLCLNLKKDREMSDGVKVHREGHVLEVVLDRGKVNAIDVSTSQALAAAFQGAS